MWWQLFYTMQKAQLIENVLARNSLKHFSFFLYSNIYALKPTCHIFYSKINLFHLKLSFNILLISFNTCDIYHGFLFFMETYSTCNLYHCFTTKSWIPCAFSYFSTQTEYSPIAWYLHFYSQKGVGCWLKCYK